MASMCPAQVGSYLYMDGEANVRINAVADEILATVPPERTHARRKRTHTTEVAAALGPKRASFASPTQKVNETQSHQERNEGEDT